ncbi:LANO_0E04544g1_1 [Lachancea nothofagi CBS 11611]|uniref:LANO_0E04544g1_1 n=1 Tax=Lachancea nothofagi CBS 11611 TaxID=1266666 RepID=A0A1G4JSK7_9SACH|nr:LANO_0E04544g1_1 [Lachancea nothofagi CBS 11611]
MSYHQNIRYGTNGQGQEPSSIPRPTSSGQILDQDGRSTTGRADLTQLHPQSNPQIYYPGFSGYGTPHGHPQPYYGSYNPYYHSGQQTAQAYGGNPYYGYAAGYPQEVHRLSESTALQTSHFVDRTDYDDSKESDRSNDKELVSHGKELLKSDDAEILNKSIKLIEPLKDETAAVKIPSTSITLESEEDIEKWREERRKMWLLKISNNREKHKLDLGVEEKELNSNTSFHSAKKEKQFIQNIQNQINRYNPNPNLSLKLIQREMAEQNTSLLNFIRELGDANLLEYELTEEEKEKLFGNNNKQTRTKSDHGNKRSAYVRGGASRYEGNVKRQNVSTDGE